MRQAIAHALGTLGNHLHVDPRPFVLGHFAPLLYHAPVNEFPSDHTLLVSAIAVIGTLWDRRLGFLLWSMALTVAVARVFVGLHHFTDVLDSIVISSAAVSLSYAIFRHRHTAIA